MSAGGALERLLEDGTRADLAAWFSSPAGDGSMPETVAWLQRRGDRLSGRSWAFWCWLLEGLPGVAADLPARGDNPYWPDAAGPVDDESGSGDA